LKWNAVSFWKFVKSGIQVLCFECIFRFEVSGSRQENTTTKKFWWHQWIKVESVALVVGKSSDTYCHVAV